MNFEKDFEEALATFYKCKVSYMVVGGYAVNLILNKMLTNRTKDKLDVEMLQRIQKL